MLAFILSNLATIIIGTLLLIAVVLAIRTIIKDKQSGKCTCGCTGCKCAGSCPSCTPEK